MKPLEDQNQHELRLTLEQCQQNPAYVEIVDHIVERLAILRITMIGNRLDHESYLKAYDRRSSLLECLDVILRPWRALLEIDHKTVIPKELLEELQ